jgi:quinol monooxygenase YgiN
MVGCRAAGGIGRVAGATPLHLSLIACDHDAKEMGPLRDALEARAVEVWANPGVVAVAVLADGDRCGLLSTWADRAAFEAWRQRLSYRRMQDFLARWSEREPWIFDCAFHEADIAPPAQHPGKPGPSTGSVVTLRQPSE